MTDDLKPLRTAADHAAALEEVARLMDASPNALGGRAQADRLGVLAVLIADWERRAVSLTLPSPTEALMLEMKLKGRTQADLARALGSRSRASELLAGRRTLTPAMADRVAKSWDMPRELLGPAEATAEPLRARKPRGRSGRAVGAVLAAAALALSAAGVAQWSLYDLPSAEPLVTAADGPDFMPLDAAPLHVRQAFLAAEDADFYRHDGTSFRGLARASMDTLANVVRGRRPRRWLHHASAGEERAARR